MGFTETLGLSGGAIFLMVTVGFVMVVTFLLFLARMYQRASKEISFVRTGAGGQKVFMNGGGFVLPVLHETISVNMNTLRLEVRRADQQALPRGVEGHDHRPQALLLGSRELLASPGASLVPAEEDQLPLREGGGDQVASIVDGDGRDQPLRGRRPPYSNRAPAERLQGPHDRRRGGRQLAGQRRGRAGSRERRPCAR